MQRQTGCTEVVCTKVFPGACEGLSRCVPTIPRKAVHAPFPSLGCSTESYAFYTLQRANYSCAHPFSLDLHSRLTLTFVLPRQCHAVRAFTGACLSPDVLAVCTPRHKPQTPIRQLKQSVVQLPAARCCTWSTRKHLGAVKHTGVRWGRAWVGSSWAKPRYPGQD